MKSFSPKIFLTLFICLMVANVGRGEENCSELWPDNDDTSKAERRRCQRDNARLRQDKEQAREDKRINRCEKMYEDYVKKNREFSKVCKSVNKTSGNSCEANLKACEKKMSGLSANGLQGNNLTEMMTGLLVNSYAQKNNIDIGGLGLDDAKSLNSCLSYENKETRAARKDADQKIEKIEDKITAVRDKITKEKEEIDKENERLRKETSDIDKDRQEVDEKMKEAIRKVDEKKGDRLRKLNEDVAKSAIAIRNLNSVIIKRKEDIESMKFDFNQKVVQFSEDKINKQCQAAVDTAKSCFVKSAKGQKALDSKDTCSNFALSSTKGARGTAELRRKIKDIQDACFEQARLGTDKAKFDHKKSIQTIETDIAEKTAQIKDAQNDLERKQNDYKSITDESDKERSQEEQNALKKMENFTKKLEGISKTVEQNIKRRNEKMAELDRNVQELMIKKLPKSLGINDAGDDIKVVYSEAANAYEEGSEALTSAKEVCCTKQLENDEASKNICKKLQADEKKINSSGKSKKNDDDSDL